MIPFLLGLVMILMPDNLKLLSMVMNMGIINHPVNTKNNRH